MAKHVKKLIPPKVVAVIPASDKCVARLFNIYPLATVNACLLASLLDTSEQSEKSRNPF